MTSHQKELRGISSSARTRFPSTLYFSLQEILGELQLFGVHCFSSLIARWEGHRGHFRRAFFLPVPGGTEEGGGGGRGRRKGEQEGGGREGRKEGTQHNKTPDSPESHLHGLHNKPVNAKFLGLMNHSNG